MTTSTLALFDRIASAVDREWRSADHRESALPAIAARLLDDVPTMDPLEVATELLTDEWLREQSDPAATFGQPPVTVAQRERFGISLLFWHDANTSIHDHAFSGAFKVVAGASVHSTYAFDPTFVGSPHFSLGDVALASAEHVVEGTVHEIHAGEPFIHMLAHLGAPSVSVVVRSHSAYLGVPQHTYLLPGVAFSPFYRDSVQLRRRQLLSLLRSARMGDIWEHFTSVLPYLDAHGVFLVANQLNVTGAPMEDIDRFLDLARPRHGECLELVRTTIRREHAVEGLLRPHPEVDPDARVLHALVGSVPSVGAWQDVAAGYFDEDPTSGLAALVERVAADGKIADVLPAEELHRFDRLRDGGRQPAIAGSIGVE